MTELVPQNRTPDERARVVPVSMAQRRLWFVDGVVGGSRDYCVVWPLRLRGPLDVDRLAAAVAAVVARHEVLRSRFVGVDGEPVMVVEPPGDVPVEFVDLSGVSESVREVELGRLVGEEGDRVFDLAAGPVARFRLVRLGVAEHVLIVAAHHIVFDGWSGSVFLRDLGVLYSGGVLPDLVVSFSDFVVWEREWLSGGVLEEQVGFWRRALAGAPSVVELPVDRVRPVRRSGAGARLAFGLDAGVVAGLSGVCRVEGATLFMGLLGVLNVVVSRYCGVSDVVVGTFASNRTMPELEELVGFFVNTLVLRTDVAGDPGFGEVVRRSRVTA
ncbi:condensation domain-containing protein, partial [Microtetraspora fusca]